MRDDVTFDRPVKAKLFVRTEHGEEWEATPADLEKFRLVDRLDVYMRTQALLLEAIGAESYDDENLPEQVHSVRYMIECAIMYDHTPWSDSDGKPWPEDEETGVDPKAPIRAALRMEI